MTEGVSSTVDSPQSPPDSRAHARHDELLVARYAARDAYEAEVAEAKRLVEACADCAALAADIQLISRATASLPTPRRRRDFRLSPKQAEQLRGSFFDRLLRRLAAPGMTAALRPIAGVALSLGIVLAVAGTGFGLPQAALPASGPAQEMLGPALDAAATPAAAPAEPAAPELVPGNDGRFAPEPDGPVRIGSGEDVDLEAVESPETADTLSLAEAPGNPLFYAGSLLALASLGVLLLSWFARRRVRDPLLR